MQFFAYTVKSSKFVVNMLNILNDCSEENTGLN